ncbi:MAG TPA: hypothetical protein VL326_05910 [Kofleriaceae bacterium]|nr:hypothetical protein [Kofleriaceae bacterium]
MSRRPSPIAVVPALLLVVVSTWEVCSTPRLAASVPGDDAWDHAEELVRAGYQPGDLIVFAPPWNDPVGRLHLGDLIPVEMAARMDAAKYGRIWELSIRDEHAPEVAGLKPAKSATVGGVTVSLYTREPAIVVSDLKSAMATMKVEGGMRPSLEVAAEVGFEPHQCLQLTPSPNQPVRITFPQLQLGSQLVAYVGLADVFTRRDIRAPGSFAIEIGGKQVASANPGVDDGWMRLSAPTTPGPADVTFIASATTGQRLICFMAEARK